ncbi:MAG: hypothetical protein K2I45_10225 [Muribaculaceae bacterium]|nr:hypothetical protein [Muribaculaceae bacterium]
MNKKNIIASTLLAILGVVPAAGESVTMYCNLISGSEPGIYSLPSEGGALTAVYPYSGLNSKQGGVFADGAYYSTLYLPGSYITQIYAVKTQHGADMSEWSYPVRINEKLAVTDVPSALAWNRMTGRVYGSFMSEDPDCWTFGTFSTDDGNASEISDLPCQLVGLAADDEGRMLGIGADGMLRSVSISGILTEIGATGVTPSPKYASGMAFDNASGVLYWAVTDKSLDTRLYTVDTADGHATPVYTFPDNTIMTALYIPDAPTPGGAPGDVADLTVSPMGFSDNVRITFTLPSRTIDGAEMLGAVKYKLLVDGAVIADSQGGPGAPVSLDASPGPGGHTVALIVSNTAGKGNIKTVDVWVGEDAPGAVCNLDISVEGTTVSMSWTPPVAGMHGGNFDIPGLVYDVVREPDGETVADNLNDPFFFETFEMTGLAQYRYIVTPRCGSLEGPSSQSRPVTVGDGMLPPYEQDFNQAESLAGIYFSAADANADGKSWTLYKSYFGDSGYARYDYSATVDADDWLFSCPFSLDKGFSYALEFTLKCGAWGNGERLGVFFGSEPDPDSMVHVVCPYADYEKGVVHTVSGDVKPELSGRYYVGIHLTSPADSYNVELDDLKLHGGVLTSVENMVDDACGLRVLKGGVEVFCPDGVTRVLDLTGRTVECVSPGDSPVRIPLPAGIYLICTGSRTFKVAVS